VEVFAGRHFLDSYRHVNVERRRSWFPPRGRKGQLELKLLFRKKKGGTGLREEHGGTLKKR